MSAPSNNYAQSLHIDSERACKDIEAFIIKTVPLLNREGAVVALSGGLDSAVAAALTIRALGRGSVHLLNMPERDSKPTHQKHAMSLARHFGVKLTVKRITAPLRASGTYNLLPIGFLPFRRLRAWLVEFGKSKLLTGEEDGLLSIRLQPKENQWVRRGAAYAVTKHRLRMVFVYQYAELHNLAVVGAANRTEWLTGTFSKWGVDHCADLMPLVHVYRSQLEEIAAYLQLPNAIRIKAADPDVMPGINDKGELLGGFESVDQILFALESGLPAEKLYQAYNHDQVDQILQLRELSKHMRESPYSLTQQYLK